jgi:CHAT domain-containing protein/Tfp pilus assembly protein PilF
MKTVLLFFLLGCSPFVRAQTYLDSLWNVWSNPEYHDTLRLWAMHKYCWDKFLFTRPDSTEYYAKLQYNMAAEKKLPMHMANGLNNQGVSWAVRGNFPKSLELFYQGLEIHEQSGNREGIASSYNNISNVYNYMGELHKSLDALNIALENYEALGDKDGMSAVYNNMGHITGDLNDSDGQLAYYRKSLKIKKDLKDKNGMATSISSIGNTYLSRGEYDKALTNFEKAVVLEKEQNNQRALSHSYTNMGIVYKNIGDYDKALDSYQLALEIYEQTGDKNGMAQCISNQGSIYQILGDHQKALKFFNQSYEMNVEMGLKKGVARNLNNMGISYSEMGEYDKALKNYEEALDIKEQLGIKKEIANTYNSIGVVLNKQQKFEEAIGYFKLASQFFESISNKKGGCIAYINHAVALKNQADSAMSKGNNLLASGYLDQSLEYGEKALNRASAIGANKESSDASMVLYYSHLTKGNIKEAAKQIRSVLDVRKKELEIAYSILSEKEKELYLKTMEDDFWAFTSFTSVAHQELPQLKGELYDNVIQNKGMLLKSSTAMRRSILNSGDSLLITEFNNWISLKKRIVKKYSDGESIDSLEHLSNELEKDLLAKSTEFSSIQKIQKLSWKTIRNELKEGEAAIEFTRYMHPESVWNQNQKEFVYAALIIQKGDKYPEFVPLFKEKDLEKILGDFPGNNLNYIEGIYGTQSESRTELYNLIWKPLEPQLANVQSVFISPDGLLHKISFSALASEQNVFLCDNYHIEIQSSTAMATNTSSYQLEEGTVISLFGGIDYNTEESGREIWNYLEGTKSEIERIAKLLEKGDHEIKFLSENDATEEEFKKVASESNLLHIATHGFFFAEVDPNAEVVESEQGDLSFRGGNSIAARSFVNSRNPLMRSGLVFAGANDVWTKKEVSKEAEDGVLTAQEVANIDMQNTDLVVLSACETGLGDIKGSEGVYGLQRSFKMAGVKHLIMSLWQVPDKETSEFMGTFYKYLSRSNDIQLAFNKTQKEMRKKYDPYYWAAFVLLE